MTNGGVGLLGLIILLAFFWACAEDYQKRELKNDCEIAGGVWNGQRCVMPKERPKCPE